MIPAIAITRGRHPRRTLGVFFLVMFLRIATHDVEAREKNAHSATCRTDSFVTALHGEKVDDYG
jgi:hypothetical protein